MQLLVAAVAVGFPWEDALFGSVWDFVVCSVSYVEAYPCRVVPSCPTSGSLQGTNLLRYSQQNWGTNTCKPLSMTIHRYCLAYVGNPNHLFQVKYQYTVVTSGHGEGQGRYMAPFEGPWITENRWRCQEIEQRRSEARKKRYDDLLQKCASNGQQGRQRQQSC